MTNFKYRDQRNPLAIIAGKSKIPQPEADQIAMELLISLDAAKRGKAPASLSNKLARHLLAATLIMAKIGNMALYKASAEAWVALKTACERPTQLLDLTTGEYQAIRKAVSNYLRSLPQIEVAMLAGAYKIAQERMS